MDYWKLFIGALVGFLMFKLDMIFGIAFLPISLALIISSIDKHDKVKIKEYKSAISNKLGELKWKIKKFLRRS
jgi:hypothetical protein